MVATDSQVYSMQVSGGLTGSMAADNTYTVMLAYFGGSLNVSAGHFCLLADPCHVSCWLACWGRLPQGAGRHCPVLASSGPSCCLGSHPGSWPGAHRVTQAP